MASKNLYFDLYGRDKSASKTMRKVGDEADGLGSAFKKMGPVIAAGIAVAGAAVIKFGADSVQAYAEAQKSQLALQDAFDRFPALADVNIQKLRDLNTEIMNKTRFDDDALAVGQATLAQYQLTGTQIEAMTPLLADYAAKTGKDIPTAAEDLGKALLGQGRALKDVGIDFTDTGTVAGNFDQLMEGLGSQVSGFAEKDVTTAEGKLENLRNKFGEVQEKVGEELMPILEDAMDWMSTDGVQAVEDLTGVLDDLKAGFDELSDSEFMKWLNGELDTGGSLDLVGGGAFEDGGLLGGPSIRDWINDFPGTWERMFGEAKTKTDEGMSGIRGGMGGGFSLMGMDMDVFRTATGEKIGGAWTDANGVTQSGLGTVAGSAGAGILGVLGHVLGFVPQPGAQLAAAWLSANSETVGGWGGIESSTGAGVGKVGTKVGEIPGVVKAPFGGAGSWLRTAGENIVDGLIGGLTGMIGSAAQAAARLAAATVTAAKNALGIHSPSTVFRDIGMNVGAGFDDGIERAMASTQRQVEALVTSPTVTANMPAAAAAQPVTIILQSRGGIDLTDYIQATVAGQDSVNVMTSKMGKQK